MKSIAITKFLKMSDEERRKGNEMNALSKPQNSVPSVPEYTQLKEMAQIAIKSKLIPANITSPEQALIIMMKGRELGIAPMYALASIAVINGKPSMSAELMLSLIYKNVRGAVIDFVKSDSTECVIEAARPNHKRSTWRFTMEDAYKAQLTSKGPWKTYPAAMLRARCISAMARAVFPDALSGVVYTPEELGADIDIASDESISQSERKTETAAELVRRVLPPKKLDLSGSKKITHDDHEQEESNSPKCLECGLELWQGRYGWYCPDNKKPGRHTKGLRDEFVEMHMEEYEKLIKRKEKEMGLSLPDEVG